MSTPLKLRAVDADDLAVLGAFLQDALIPVQDMRFLREENRFVMVANRFVWESLSPGEDPGAGPYERVLCGITFEHVESVQAKGFKPGAAEDRGRLLEVLTILAEDGLLTVVFSGGAAIRLGIGEVQAFVQDLDEPWPTLWRPSHPIEDELDRNGGTR